MKATDAMRMVVLARRPQAGRVKTRLVAGGLVDGQGARAIAAAMLACTVRRLTGLGPVVLALTPDGAEEGRWPEAEGCGLRGLLRGGRVRIIDQGPGDLGARLERLWRRLAPARPVAFFGTDSPDVPAEALAEIGPALAQADVAVGPTADGGYWTLAARRYLPAVLGGIDWGTPAVYDQTRRRAEEGGLRMRALRAWHDVDRPEDLAALRRRLLDCPDREPDEPLIELRRRIDSILRPPGPGAGPGDFREGPRS